MWSTTAKSLLANKVRLLLTALAVVLGVAFVTGTLVLTDTLMGTFDDLIGDAYEGVDVAVLGTELTDQPGTPTPRTPVPLDVVDRVRGVEGVAVAEAEVQGTAQLVAADGSLIGNPQAPTLGGQAPAVEELYAVRLRDGSYPAAAGEIAIDVATATANDLSIGDTVGVTTGGAVTEQTIVGLVGWGQADGAAGATLTLFDPTTAFELFNRDGGVQAINVQALDGVSADVLVERITAALPETAASELEVLTGAEVTASNTDDIADQLGFFSSAMLAFAGVSLFVGAFIIANTFSIIVAQRTRQLALLRAVGASRRQVLISVLAEAAATGLVGAVLGVGLGIGVAVGLRALLDAFGLSLPDGDLVVTVDTILTGLAVGVVVTTLSAVGPAVRSVRVPPVAAMQAVAAPPPARAGRIRTALGSLFTLGGLAAIAAGLLGDAGVAAVGGGAGVVILGVALLASHVAGPVMAVLGTPLGRVLGVRGDLATENARRNPRRTASTASALMIGLGLVSFVVIFGASITASAAAAIEGTFSAELTVRPIEQSPTARVPDDLPAQLQTIDGVAAAMPMHYVEFVYDDATTFGVGVDPATFDQVANLDYVQGELVDLTEGGLAVKSSVADGEGWSVGDTVPLRIDGEVHDVVLRAVFEGDIDVSWILDSATVLATAPDAGVGQVMIRLDEGVELTAVRPHVDQLVASYPTVQVQDADELQASIEAQIDQLLGLMTALLLLSIVIALFGLVNTLGLSVYERTRELGLLRAVGATRQQVRSIVRWEAVLITALGATLGLGIGVLFGWMAVTALADEGISQFAMPAGQLLLGVLAAGVAGVVAAIGPARRAARTDILRALQMQ